MPGKHWRGTWYVYHHARREFVREMRPDDPRLTPSIRHAKIYKNPSIAQKAAGRINAMLNRPGPCQPVSVVTGEAARCLDQINRRDAHATTEIHHP